MSQFLTYMHLLTPLHTGGSADEGNLMGIAREVHTEFPYLPSSSLRGRIRAAIEQGKPKADEKPEVHEKLIAEAGQLFGRKIKDGHQPTEGEVWFADATLLSFPIASLTHHLVWITCPLWLTRWNRWLKGSPLTNEIQLIQSELATNSKVAVSTFATQDFYVQTALLRATEISVLPNSESQPSALLELFPKVDSLLSDVTQKLIIISNENCIALVETGLQREVRVALKDNSKMVDGGSFRSEEAIPPEAIMFVPWGIKTESVNTHSARDRLKAIMTQRCQFGGLEGLGRGWVDLQTIDV
jgi:CRISPR-associated protein Cmr4